MRFGHYPFSGVEIGGGYGKIIHVFGYEYWFLLLNTEKISMRLGKTWVEIKFGRN